MTNTNLAVVAYPDELLQFLRKGSLERISITFPQRRMADSMRGRINALRTAMKREDHPLYPLVAKASIRIEFPNHDKDRWKVHQKWHKDENYLGPAPIMPEDGPAVLICEPREYELMKYFHAAGIKPEKMEDEFLSGLPITPEEDEEDEDKKV